MVAIGAAIALSSMGGPPLGMHNNDGTEMPDRTEIDNVTGSGETIPQLAAVMTEGGYTAEEARQLAEITTEVLGQNSTYLNYRQSLPSGESRDVVMKIILDQTYVPTENEISEAATSGMQVYNMSASFSQVNNVPAMKIRYFVPYSAMSEEVLAIIESPQEQPVSAEPISVLPPAEAAGGLVGAGFDLFSLGTMMESKSDHTEELERLMDCARNPTNPVTKKTFEENPQEKQRTLDEIENAQSEINRLSGARVLNQLGKIPGLFLHLNPALHVLIEGAAEWSEHTLKHLAEERLEQAMRAVVSCEPTPVPASAASGTIQYSFSRTEIGCADESSATAGMCTENKDERTGSGTFFLTNRFGAVSGNGSGTFTQTRTGTTTNPPNDPDVDYGIGNRAVSRGEIIIEVSGVAALGATRLEFYANGDSLAYDYTGTWMEAAKSGNVVYTEKPVHRDDYHGGFSCVFDNVDLVSGGSYEVETEGGDGICKLELAGG